MSIYVKDLDPEAVEKGVFWVAKYLYLSDTLCHYGVKGMKWGVRRTPEQLGHLRNISVDITGKKCTMRIVNRDHKSNPPKSVPFAIITHIGKDGKPDVRSYYGKTGWKELDIHTTDHGHPKQHNYGKHHEHAHEYEWYEDGTPKRRTTREILARERKENKDIL